MKTRLEVSRWSSEDMLDQEPQSPVSDYGINRSMTKAVIGQGLCNDRSVAVRKTKTLTIQSRNSVHDNNDYSDNDNEKV